MIWVLVFFALVFALSADQRMRQEQSDDLRREYRRDRHVLFALAILVAAAQLALDYFFNGS